MNNTKLIFPGDYLSHVLKNRLKEKYFVQFNKLYDSKYFNILFKNEQYQNKIKNVCQLSLLIRWKIICLK